MFDQTHTVSCRFLQLSPIRASAKTTQAQVEWTSKQYHYLTKKDVKPGDYAVVMSPIFNEPALVKVEEVFYNTKTSQAFKFLIDIVDFSEYQTLQAQLAAEIAQKRERQRRANELQQTIAMARQRVEAQLIEERLRSDPVIESAMNELKYLQTLD